MTAPTSTTQPHDLQGQTALIAGAVVAADGGRTAI